MVSMVRDSHRASLRRWYSRLSKYFQNAVQRSSIGVGRSSLSKLS
jgi:hypothetical protein